MCTSEFQGLITDSMFETCVYMQYAEVRKTKRALLNLTLEPFNCPTVNTVTSSSPALFWRTIGSIVHVAESIHLY